ncbi:MAG: SprT-like domain-containing protein [Candidatus Thiodiazotropha sp.]
MAEKPTTESYDTLVRAYDYFNQALFEGQLPDVIISFHRQRKVMGYASIARWVNEKRQYVDELAVNPEYFAKYPLIEICQTLCHEMVHIWQAHFGNPGRRGYHNVQWARKMTQIGLMPSSTGKPGGSKTGEWMMDYVLLDGSFHRVCQQLLKSGYRLPWVDRYPVYRLDLPVVAYGNSGELVELDSKLQAKPKSAVDTAMKMESAALPDEAATSSSTVCVSDSLTPTSPCPS